MPLKMFLKNLGTSRRLVWRLPRILILMLVIGVGGLMLFETKLIFFPERFSAGDKPYSWRVDSGKVIDVEEILFDSMDGTRLCGWYYSTRGIDLSVKPSHVILLCHGNAGHLAHRHQKSAALCNLGPDVFIFDYRGYGKSDGAPNEAGVCMDVRAAWNVLLERGWAPEQVIIYGKSIGGSIGIDLAKDVNAAALITESTFTSIPDMATAVYPFVPRSIVRTQLNSAEKIGSITCPKLFMHGKRDSMIPYEMTVELHDKAVEPKAMVLFPNGDHNDVFYQPGYLEAWSSFLSENLGISPAASGFPENTGGSGESP